MIYPRLKKGKGFTLIELMIVIIIIGVLAAIAWPQYIDFVRKSRKTDAQAMLLEASSYAERLFTSTQAYPTQAELAAKSLDTSPTQGTTAYAITIAVDPGAAAGVPSYLLTATPAGDQATYTGCGAAGTVMTLNYVGAMAPAAGCWQ